MIQNTIQESFVLPSKGLVYDPPIDPHVILRSMTVAEEMKRQAHTETPYKAMADIIEDCLVTKLPLHVYQLCLGDYEFLLHKLRIVTYGSDYRMTCKCTAKECGSIDEHVGNLESIEVKEYDESITTDKLITLPLSNRLIELKMRTPQDMDLISYKANEMKKRTKLNLNYAYMYSIISVISKIDGQVLEPIFIEEFVKNLLNKDASYILKKAAELEAKIGMGSTITMTCKQCGNNMQVPFRATSEFYGPTDS